MTDSDFAQERLRSSLYWGLHIVGWIAAVVIVFGPWGLHFLRAGEPPMELAGVLLSACLLALVVSVGLALIFAVLPEAWLIRPRRGFPAIAALVALGTLLWSAGLQLVLCRTSYLGADVLRIAPLWSVTHTGLLLAGWSAFFFLPLIARGAREAREHALRMEVLAQAAQLGSLRARLQPHFLFNALNSVIGLMEEDTSRAKDMMRDLAALLRRATDSSQSEMSTIGQELEFAVQYLECERVRFGDDLRTQINAHPEITRLPIPALLLQPLVENAIKHGMAGSDPVEVGIMGRRQGQRVRLKVYNSGRLLPRSSEVGEGLKLVRHRLEAHYGREGCLTLAQEGPWVVAEVAYTLAASPGNRPRTASPNRTSTRPASPGAGPLDVD